MKLKAMIDISSKMSSVNRHHSFRTITNETLSHHTGEVLFFSFMIAKNLIKRGYKIDFEKLYSKALLHDLEEIETGDIPSIVKHYNDLIKEQMYAIGYDKISKIEKLCEFDILNDWKSSKDKFEGLIVSVSDYLCMVSLLWIEHNLGNMFIKSLTENMIRYSNLLFAEIEFVSKDNFYLLGLIGQSREIINEIKSS